jgi:hypothetical protein
MGCGVDIWVRFAGQRHGGSDRHHLRRVSRKPLANQKNVALWGIPM